MSVYDNWKLDNGESWSEVSGSFADVCKEIEADNSLSIACNTAESMTGNEYEPDRLSVRIEHDRLYVDTSIGVTVCVDESNPQADTRRQLSNALRAVADQLDRREKLDQRHSSTKPKGPAKSDALVFCASAIALVVITSLACGLWY